ncbi:MAG TPA: polysaccharide deacetylase family protein [Gammaproteobacteria bacterium]|nr:polysaccharide deacetylase family protein [Gammaproteobacteria bacterium]
MNAGSRLSVLMYHAVYDGPAERLALAPEERPYAVSRRDFEAQLDMLAGERLAVVDPGLPDGFGAGRAHGVLLTFDDGHRSWHRHVLPALRERRLKGLFFVSTGLVGTRQDYCDWTELAELAAEGNCIGSHGVTHRFLDDLRGEPLVRELADSRETIRARLGGPVTAIAFPGGRFRGRTLANGRAAGYRFFYTSRIGIVAAQDVRRGLPVPRIAVRDGMSAAGFRALARGEPATMARHRAVAAAKTTARKLLGNRIYHGLYRKFAA